MRHSAHCTSNRPKDPDTAVEAAAGADLDLGSNPANCALNSFIKGEGKGSGNGKGKLTLQPRRSAERGVDSFEDCSFGDAGAFQVATSAASAPAPSSSSSTAGQLVTAPSSETSVTLQELFQDLTATSSSTEAIPAASALSPPPADASQPPPFLPLATSFGDLLDGGLKTYALANGYLRMKPGVTLDTKSTIAEVYQDEGLTQRLGTIGCATPLREAKGLKATCERHKAQKGQPKCTCWINFRKKEAADATSEQRWRIFRSMADWIADASSTDAAKHAESSAVLRMAAGILPKGFKDEASLGYRVRHVQVGRCRNTVRFLESIESRV